ncbi:hypothetical protein AB0B12_20070 [Streptomyces sp. NPDC044780]|uniref:hypothetical protein n=1 Tax=unclassified Streptomyces TaxID=2593676 RepID=UPI00341107CB
MCRAQNPRSDGSFPWSNRPPGRPGPGQRSGARVRLPGFADGTVRAITLTGQAEGRAVPPNPSACGARDAARLQTLSPAACEDHAERVLATPHRMPERER